MSVNLADKWDVVESDCDGELPLEEANSDGKLPLEEVDVLIDYTVEGVLYSKECVDIQGDPLADNN